MKRLVIGVVLAGMLLAACGDDTTSTTGSDGTTGTGDTTGTTASGEMDALVAAAQEEGTLTTIALPDDWCGYRAVIDNFKAKYGLEVNELTPGAGSAEELEAIDANRENPGPQAPDVIDVGISYGPEAMEAGLIQPYKVATWDEIPDEFKDPDGNWYGDYYGVLALSVNTAEVDTPPAEYADLLDPAYNGSGGTLR